MTHALLALDIGNQSFTRQRFESDNMRLPHTATTQEYVA